MSDPALANVIPSVQFLDAPDGRRLAVMDAGDWERLVEWLEDLEDQRIVRAARDRLLAGPESSGAVPLESILDEL